MYTWPQLHGGDLRHCRCALPHLSARGRGAPGETHRGAEAEGLYKGSRERLRTAALLLLLLSFLLQPICIVVLSGACPYFSYSGDDAASDPSLSLSSASPSGYNERGHAQGPYSA